MPQPHRVTGAPASFQVLRHALEQRSSRTTSLYLLVYAVVWAPPLLSRLVSLRSHAAPTFLLAAVEAVSRPIQGALNAALYGWSLPSIRDMYRRLLLGDDGADALRACNGTEPPGGYSPPDSDSVLPVVSSVLTSRDTVGAYAAERPVQPQALRQAVGQELG